MTPIDKMDRTLKELLKWAKTYNMSPEEIKAQRISFAYGNLVLHNPLVTHKDIEKAAEELEC